MITVSQLPSLTTVERDYYWRRRQHSCSTKQECTLLRDFVSRHWQLPPALNMPSVEEIPNSSASKSAPGWSYEVDTGYDPSKAPIVPSGARKRGRDSLLTSIGPDSTAAGKAALTARQQSKIAKHLAELDRDSAKDVQIVVPGKPKDVGQRTMTKSGKMTPGVRKILISQKTWANYLADEEAALANAPVAGPVEKVQVAEGERRASSEVQKRGAGRVRGTPGRKKKGAVAVEKQGEVAEIEVDTSTVEQTPGTSSTQNGLPPTTGPPPTVPIPTTEGDDDPFLKSRIPPLPTQAEIDALLAAPPLSYNAARAGPTTNTAPPRQFCEICGYWGRARCMKCGVRICGLECKTQHEETRCLKFYA